jgi:hypothetical protein
MHLPPFVRGILQGLFVFAVLMLTIFLTIFAVNFTYRKKAEGLLKDIRTLRAAQSTKADVERIMSRHGGSPSQSYASFCTPIDGAYDVWTGSQGINRLERDIPILRRFGLRQWGTGATVVLRRGRVCYLHYGVGMEDPNGQWQWSVESNLMPDRQSDVFGDEQPRYKVGTRDYKGVRRLRSELTPEATEEERRRAFTYDFSCVTRFRGCRQPCEIAPLVWQDVYQQNLNSGWTTPVEEVSDPHCKFAENPR